MSHKLHTNHSHRKEEPHNNHETPGRQTEQSNQLSLPHPDDCKTRIWTQRNAQQNIEQSQNPTMGVTINNESTTTEPPALNGQQPKPLGGLNAFYCYQIFAIDSAVVEAHKILRSHGGVLTIAMYYHRETM